MPPLILAPTNTPVSTWNLDYNGLTLGAFTPYELISISGWTRPPIRVDETEKMADHGSFIYAQYLQPRVWQISGDMTGDVESGEFAQNEALLRQAFGPQVAPIPLRLMIPGWGTKVSFCKPELFDIPVDTSYAIGYAQWALQLRAGDPRLYSDDLELASTTSETFSGYAFNYAFPYSFGGGSSGLMTCTNNGTFDTPPVIRVGGPFTSAIVTHLESGRKIQLNLTVADGDWVTIDAEAKTVMVNDSASRYDALDPLSQWFNFIPGDNTLLFVAVGNAFATVSWRSAWI